MTDADSIEPAVETDASAEPACASRHWIGQLAARLQRTDPGCESRVPTVITCARHDDAATLMIPADMALLQSDSLHYLQHFARRHGFRLLEDRRQLDLKPIVEQRHARQHPIARGLGLLLRQTGLPGSIEPVPATRLPAHVASTLSLFEVLALAARSRDRSKRVVVLPNEALSSALDGDTHPVAIRACKLVGPRASTVLSQMESPAFRCVGYAVGLHYIIHWIVGAGPIDEPELWSDIDTLVDGRFRFQLFRGARPSERIGVLHASFHFDLSGAEHPWWLEEAGEEASEDASRHDAAVTLPEENAHKPRF